ncbi:MFS transporter [Sorangium sp. So ce1182]
MIAPQEPGANRGAALGLMPASATTDARTLLVTRALRGFADGAVSVLLADYLSLIGLSPLQIGAIVTGTLLGSAALTLALGLLGHRLGLRRLLLAASALMFATGLGFLGVTAFWPLLVIAVAGTLNPSAGDVSVFLPAEQASLSGTVEGRDRTRLFARYNLSGNLAGAVGALASGLPVAAARRFGWDRAAAERSGFALYAAVAVAVGVLYWKLSPTLDQRAGAATASPLRRSRRIVFRLAALFSLDSFGGGFIVQSLLALWLFRRFALSVETTGAIFFAAGVAAGFSQLVSARLAGRIGLINTMVYTHLPSNVLLILATLMPTAPLAVGFLLLRMCLSQMDVPARQSYVMAVVPPEERPAAASVTNVPRSLAAALAPLLAGAMLSRSSFGWPLLCAGVAKTVYDVLLLIQFGALKPPEETADTAVAAGGSRRSP